MTDLTPQPSLSRLVTLWQLDLRPQLLEKIVNQSVVETSNSERSNTFGATPTYQPTESTDGAIQAEERVFNFSVRKYTSRVLRTFEQLRTLKTVSLGCRV